MSGYSGRRGARRCRRRLRRWRGIADAGRFSGARGVLSFAPRRGARRFREAETTKCAFAFIATTPGRGRRAIADVSSHALESPTRRGIWFPLRSGYAAVAAA